MPKSLIGGMVSTDARGFPALLLVILFLHWPSASVVCHPM